MNPNAFINALFLCLLNVSFMVLGMFLNSQVILSFTRSSQLRKNLGYFMIFVLSCFDLIAVATAHPVLILSTIMWSLQHIEEDVKYAWEYVNIFTAGSSMYALLTLNVERFIALKYPFFHQTAVTKKRLVCFLAFMMITQIVLSPLYYFYGKTLGNILITGFVLLLVLVFAYLNYEMLRIAVSKRKNEMVCPSDTCSREERKKHIKINFKNISTCSLTVACFFICSLPQIVYSASRVRSESSENDDSNWLFNLWSSTFVSFNSTFNCLIFFWRNSILRREGMKITKCLSIA